MCNCEFTNDDILKLWRLTEDAQIDTYAAALHDYISELHDRIDGLPQPLSADEEREALERWGNSPTPAPGGVTVDEVWTNE